MKIEKLTENKIRIVLKQKDLNNKNLLVDILDKAKKDHDFDTDGYKLLIETFSAEDDFFVFTITKYHENVSKPKKIVKPQKIVDKKFMICVFDNFDAFCSFCSFVNNNINSAIIKCFSNSKVYVHNGLYYLIVRNNTTIKFLLREFGNLLNYSESLEAKLSEYGKCIAKKNALDIIKALG